MTLAATLELSASAITPFDDRGHVHEDALRMQLGRFADAGLGVWLVSSGSAEANVLEPAEVDRIAEIAVAEIAGKVPVRAMGIEPRSAKDAIDFASRMADRGVDAVQVGPVDPGHSYLPTEGELRAFYDAVLDAIEVPGFLASHMSVGYDVPAELLATVARERRDVVVGVNATNLREYVYVPRLLDAVGDDVPVHLGSPVHALENLALGASGIVSSMDVNVAPALYARLGDAWKARDLDAVAAAHTAITRLFLRILTSGGLIVAKAILVRLGVPVGTTRPPRRPAGEVEFRRADEIIEEFSLRA